MKKYILMAFIMAVGMAVYPQSNRSAKGNKNEKTNVKKEVVRQSTGRSEVQGRSVRSRSQTIRKNETKASNRSGNNAVRKSGQTAATRSVARTRTTSGNTGRGRVERTIDPPDVKMSSSSANHNYRESKGTLTRGDGTVIRHQNDEIFTKSKYKVDYADHDAVRKSEDFRRVYKDYNYWYDTRTVRYTSHYPRYRPLPVDYRRAHYAYPMPMHYDLIWTPFLFNRFMYYYPGYTNWDVEYGREIETISSFEVMNYVGTVRRIYGKVDEVYYSREDNNYILYMGAPFPYQDLSIVIPGQVAYQITRNPERYFKNKHIWVIGLINTWEGKPEVVIRDEEQMRRY